MSWVMVPLFKGVGISMNLINNYVNIYYIMIIAYSLYYLVLSFRLTLPWDKCAESWRSDSMITFHISSLPCLFWFRIVLFLFLFFIFYYKDCVDNFTEGNFRYSKNCTELGEPRWIQCENGVCYLDPMQMYDNKTCVGANLTRTAYWDPIFPSQDYWKYITRRRRRKKEQFIYCRRIKLYNFIKFLFKAK